MPLRAELTVAEPKPARPALSCTDADRRPTICNRDMADWLNAYDRALDSINRRMAEIRGLQPIAD